MSIFPILKGAKKEQQHSLPKVNTCKLSLCSVSTAEKKQLRNKLRIEENDEFCEVKNNLH